jgi:hypothetical protein
MFCKLICTSFNKINNSTLGLRAEWIEECETTERLDELLKLWGIEETFPWPRKNEVSEIIDGKMQNDCPIHIRIVRY